MERIVRLMTLAIRRQSVQSEVGCCKCTNRMRFQTSLSISSRMARSAFSRDRAPSFQSFFTLSNSSMTCSMLVTMRHEKTEKWKILPLGHWLLWSPTSLLVVLNRRQIGFFSTLGARHLNSIPSSMSILARNTVKTRTESNHGQKRIVQVTT